MTLTNAVEGVTPFLLGQGGVYLCTQTYKTFTGSRTVMEEEACSNMWSLVRVEGDEGEVPHVGAISF